MRTVPIKWENEFAVVEDAILVMDQEFLRMEMTDDEVRDAWIERYNRDLKESDPLHRSQCE